MAKRKKMRNEQRCRRVLQLPRVELDEYDLEAMREGNALARMGQRSRPKLDNTLQFKENKGGGRSKSNKKARRVA